MTENSSLTLYVCSIKMRRDIKRLRLVKRIESKYIKPSDSRKYVYLPSIYIFLKNALFSLLLQEVENADAGEGVDRFEMRCRDAVFLEHLGYGRWGDVEASGELRAPPSFFVEPLNEVFHDYRSPS